jgi:hypothetical protein
MGEAKIQIKESEVSIYLFGERDILSLCTFAGREDLPSGFYLLSFKTVILSNSSFKPVDEVNVPFLVTNTK